MLELAADADDRVGYNALWILTHLPARERKWLEPHRDRLIDLLLADTHVGKQRLLLTLLEHQKVSREDIRTDYLDFCLAHINSAAPYALRAFCLKQAYAQCRHYPELLAELQEEMHLMDYSQLSPGLLSARRIVLRQLKKDGADQST